MKSARSPHRWESSRMIPLTLKEPDFDPARIFPNTATDIPAGDVCAAWCRFSCYR